METGFTLPVGVAGLLSSVGLGPAPGLLAVSEPVVGGVVAGAEAAGLGVAERLVLPDCEPAGVSVSPDPVRGGVGVGVAVGVGLGVGVGHSQSENSFAICGLWAMS